jgi:hypothetical protein
LDVRANQAWSETKDGMRIDWDVPIEMDDDLVLRADVFRPDGDGRYPVILGATPYGKWLSFQDEVWGGQWKMLCAHEREILQLSSNKYQNYEFADPERFVPDPGRSHSRLRPHAYCPESVRRRLLSATQWHAANYAAGDKTQQVGKNRATN